MTNPDRFKATYLGTEVWFIKDESYREGIPSDAITYTLEEAQIMARMTERAKRLVHETKKAITAKVTRPPLL